MTVTLGNLMLLVNRPGLSHYHDNTFAIAITVLTSLKYYIFLKTHNLLLIIHSPVISFFHLPDDIRQTLQGALLVLVNYSNILLNITYE